MTEAPMQVDGACHCGDIRYTATIDPAKVAICHCTDCRDWSATPVTAYSLWPADKVRVLDGADKVTRFNKMGKATRCSCSVCGGAVMAELPGAGLVDVYPMFLKDVPFEPTAHVHYAERVMDMADGLVKYKDLPAEAGGSGETLG